MWGGSQGNQDDASVFCLSHHRDGIVLGVGKPSGGTEFGGKEESDIKGSALGTPLELSDLLVDVSRGQVGGCSTQRAQR